jgi:hypothetical protein
MLPHHVHDQTPSGGAHPCAVPTVLLVGLFLLSIAAAPLSEAGPGGQPPIALTPERVLASLDQTLTWYREARLAMRALGTVFTREDEQTALAVLRRAFETARAQAALLAVGGESATAPRPASAGPLEGKRTQALAAIHAAEQEVERLRQRLRTAPRAQRSALQDQVAAAANRLELARVRLEFLSKLEESNISSSGPDADLTRQIKMLEDSLPELHEATNRPSAAATPASGSTGGQWNLVQRLIGNYHTRSSLDRLDQRTGALQRSIAKDLQATKADLHPVVSGLRELTNDPSPHGSLADGQKSFHELLQRNKALSTVLLSLREESALVNRFVADLQGWKASVDRERRQILQNLGIGLIGVVITLVAILVAGVLWRVAAVRYVRDAYRRRLLLMGRNVVVVTAMAFVLIFHFASELTALVTGLGFAAAGVAFALQNVILALAGYFSMVAPNGIRTGDRVGLQGPFSYVQGEVLDIGLVRIRLRELDGHPLRPTGRIVVFPNSVVFTGSFFKHPPSEDREDGPREERKAAA